MMDDHVEVRFTVPAKTWWTLAEHAEQRGQDVREYIAALITADVTQPTPEQVTDAVLRLHSTGLSVKMIARRLGMTNAAVQSRLYSNGLRANRAREKETA